MSIRNILILIFIGFAGLLGGLVCLSFLTDENQHRLEASEERRFMSYQLADELRQSSDDLTRFARIYVITGDPVYEGCFHDVMAIRDGKKPRPENYGRIYWDFVLATGEQPATDDGASKALKDLMREMQFTDEEFLKLEESKARSDRLAILEEQAMNAVKGRFRDESGGFSIEREPNFEMARRIMFGEEYHQAKAAIMKPIDEFLVMLDRRTVSEVQALQAKGRFFTGMTLGLAVGALVFTFFTFIVLYRRILIPVRKLVVASKQVEAGKYGERVDYASADELGNLASSFNLMSGAIQRDVAEREKIQGVLAEAQEAADEANRAKSDFLSNMSHELRTPLNGVLGYVQILQRDRTLGAAQKKSLDSISHCGEHLLSLINDVLDLSKIEAGKMEIAPAATDLSQLIDGVRDIVKPKAEDKGLTFNVKTSPEVPRGIITDPIKLRQVLINLLGNSVKFTSKGVVTLRVAEAAKGQLRFEIEDTGMGISPEKLTEIFEPFKQADAGQSEGGTGLGLAISRRIAEALGGTLTAISELGEGSCFTLTLPLEETDDIKPSEFSATAPDSHASFCLPPGEKRSVLIADDRETNRDILDQLLADAGFETVLADDGDVALDRLRERAFDIVLCDVRMPRMNGIEVIKEIRRDRNLKSNIVIAVTASVFPEFRDQALDAGFDDFLMKPLNVSELAQKMAKFLDVEFVRLSGDDEENALAADIDPVELFEALPAEIIEKLAEAAKVRNLTRLTDIAKELLENEQTSVAGHHLEGLILTFDFAGLQAIVDFLTPAEQKS